MGKNLTGGIFDFHFQSGEMAQFVSLYSQTAIARALRERKITERIAAPTTRRETEITWEMAIWLYLFRLQKSVNLHSFGKRSSNWVFTVSLGGMSEISDKKNNSHADSDVAHRYFIVGFGTLKLLWS